MIDNETYRINIIHRVLSRATRQANGCLYYCEGKRAHKYGLLSVTIDGKHKNIPAHRALYMATNDCLDLPRDVFIRHKCDNPPCVDMAHLERGTAKDNMRDSIVRKRRPAKHRAHTRVRVFDDATIRAIRTEPGTLRAVSRKFDVSESYVSKLRHGKAKQLVS